MAASTMLVFARWLSLLISRIALGKRLKEQEAQRARDETEEAEMMAEWKRMRAERADD